MEKGVYLLTRQKRMWGVNNIHFCFPCPISGIRSFLCSSSDRSIGRSRGFQWGWNWNGASEGKEGRSVWEIEDFESSWRDGKIPVAGGRLPLGWKILTYIELKWQKQLCMFQIFSYRISHNIEGKGSVKRPPARPRPDAHRGGIHETFPPDILIKWIDGSGVVNEKFPGCRNEKLWFNSTFNQRTERWIALQKYEFWSPLSDLLERAQVAWVLGWEVQYW